MMNEVSVDIGGLSKIIVLISQIRLLQDDRSETIAQSQARES